MLKLTQIEINKWFIKTICVDLEKWTLTLEKYIKEAFTVGIKSTSTLHYINTSSELSLGKKVSHTVKW